MDFGNPGLSLFLREDRSTMHSPDFEGLTFEVDRRLTWPAVGRAIRSVVRKVR
jgi:hypothetical protein